MIILTVRRPTTMQRYDLMFRSGAASQYRAANRWQERRKIKRALQDVLPPDRTWQVALLVAALWIGIAVLFARYWLM